jgi:hypothetical protein
MRMPEPTPIYRIVHIDNLPMLLEHQGLHAPNAPGRDDTRYRKIHNEEIQEKRRQRRVPCGPQGVIHDYVSFYFGPRSPMLFQLHTGWVKHYHDGQEPIIYLVSTVQRVAEAGLPFVFSDGHGIKAFTRWFSSLGDLAKVDWDAAYATIWKDTIDDMDRQRRKQAEFLIHKFCPWEVIESIGVRSQAMKEKTERALSVATSELRPVEIRTDWYYRGDND